MVTEELLAIYLIIFSLVGIVLLIGITKRTTGKIKQAFSFILVSMIAFLAFGTLSAFKVFQIIDLTIVADLFEVFFVLFMIASFWNLRSLIKDMSDFGQALVLTSKDKHDDKLLSIIKDSKEICFVTLERPYRKLVDFFSVYNIDTAKMHFIDASDEVCNEYNCTKINNDPEELKSNISRILKEKNINCILIDNISAVKKIKDFELPKFVQETALIVKSNKVQGFFIEEIDKISKQIMNDISMLVDKVVGDEEWKKQS